MAMAIRNWTTPITPCSASYQVGPRAGIIPPSCNAEAGRRNTPKRKAIRTSQKVHRQRRKTPTTRTAISAESSNEQRRLNREAFPVDLLQGLRGYLRGEDQNRNERDPIKHKEPDHQLVGANEDCR